MITIPTPKTQSAQSVKSMTGYAQARAEHDGWQLRISLRSVNHRFLDLRMRLPEGFEVFEPAIRQLVRDRLRRGHVDITLHADAAGATSVEVNREVAAAYLRTVEGLRRDFSVSGEPDLVALLRLPGVVTGHGVASIFPLDEETVQELGAQIAACVEEALARLEEMRTVEGRSLAAEMHVLASGISEKAEQLQVLTERSRPAYALRLRARLEELLGDSRSGAVLEPARLAQEAALLAERADVSEELARLRSHVAQFGKLVEGGGELGKKLDFLLQEMQREANTLLSKTPALGDDALAVTELGLQIKSEIEKIREQVQNVE